MMAPVAGSPRASGASQLAAESLGLSPEHLITLRSADVSTTYSGVKVRAGV